MILSLLKLLHRNESSLATVGHVSQVIDLNEEQSRLCVAWKLTCRRQLSGSRSSRRKSSRRSRSRISLIGRISRISRVSPIPIRITSYYYFISIRISLSISIGITVVLVLVVRYYIICTGVWAKSKMNNSESGTGADFAWNWWMGNRLNAFNAFCAWWMPAFNVLHIATCLLLTCSMNACSMHIPPVERETQLEPCISASIATTAQVAFSEAFVLSEETKQKRRHALRFEM